jgi:hypothetical protein
MNGRHQGGLLGLIALLLSVGGSVPGAATAQSSPDPGIETAPSMASALPVTVCPVTVPGPAPETFAERLFGSAAAHGDGDLWVGGLPDSGVLFAEPQWLMPDGSVSWKLGWWRIAAGPLLITGRRLDGPAPALRAHVPDRYGSAGFQASGVDFPTDGCWEVTGRVGDASLIFVVLVQRSW